MPTVPVAYATLAHVALQAEILAHEVRDAHQLEQRDIDELARMVANCLLFLSADRRG